MTEALLVSNLLLWCLVIVLALVVLALARQVGVQDLAGFEASLENIAISRKVKADMALASDLLMFGTPMFLVNGKPISGAQPLDVFRAEVQQALETYLRQTETRLISEGAEAPERRAIALACHALIASSPFQFLD